MEERDHHVGRRNGEGFSDKLFKVHICRKRATTVSAFTDKQHSSWLNYRASTDFRDNAMSMDTVRPATRNKFRQDLSRN